MAETTGAQRRGLLADLVAGGRFCRDTRLGGILHPGVVSLREVTDGDSLHVCIDAEDRLSVHVDRFSPVAGGRENGCCRYSVRAVVAHLAAHLAAQAHRLASGARGRHRCRLQCELVEVDADGSAGDPTSEDDSTFELRCDEIGDVAADSASRPGG